MLATCRLLSVATTVLGAGLTFIHMRWGISCLALSIACAQWANHLENRLYAGWTQQSLFVVLQSLHGLHARLKTDALEASQDISPSA